MKWYTIYVVNPQPEIAKECHKNCAGQFILFDGQSYYADARNNAIRASFKSEEVQIFRGKMRGELLLTIRNRKIECSWCGKAHLDVISLKDECPSDIERIRLTRAVENQEGQ